jgi:hypothetical protein
METFKFDFVEKEINWTPYTVVAVSKDRAIEVMEEESGESTEDFEIIEQGKAINQMGKFFPESFQIN